jgi:ferrochelatase
MSFRAIGAPVLGVGAVVAAIPLARRYFAKDPPLKLDPAAQRDALQKNRTGVIVCNIGSPKTTSTADVRTYLSRFLGDDRVLDITPAWKKWLVLNIILLVRPKDSAENYKKVWDEERGSPLKYLTDDLVQGLQDKLGDDYDVQTGMSFSDPLIKDVMAKFAAEGTNNVVVVPNYPNYASSTTGSSLQDVYLASAKNYVVPNLIVVPPFFRQPGFLEVWAKNIEAGIGKNREKVDHLVISFHGVPERHCTPCDPLQGTADQVCQKSADCCAKLSGANKQCYRAQCYETARRIAKKLNMPDDYYTVAFQSRLTLRDSLKWIDPYTDYKMEELGKAGVERIAICAPSFSIDCLETLDELQRENREIFEEFGGKEFVYIPCPNADPAWVASLADVVQKASPSESLSW